MTSFQERTSVAGLLAGASLSQLTFPELPPAGDLASGLVEIIAGKNSQAGYLAEARLNATTPMAAGAIDGRFTQIAGGVGVLALAYGALKNIINERNG